MYFFTEQHGAQLIICCVRWEVSDNDANCAACQVVLGSEFQLSARWLTANVIFDKGTNFERL